METTPPESNRSQTDAAHGMTDQPPGPPPVVEQVSELDFTKPARWPKVIGIISLIYAIGGLLCQGLGALNSVMGEWLASLGGIDITMPPAMKIIGAASAVVTSIVGLVLLFGAIGLLRRRKSGLSLHKAWAAMRLVLIVIGLGLGVVMIPAQVDMQRSITEAQNRRLREANRPEITFDENAIVQRSKIMLGAMTGATAIYPLFVGFYLSRKKIAAEVEDWDVYRPEI
jgi:hypothetical protein